MWKALDKLSAECDLQYIKPLDLKSVKINTALILQAPYTNTLGVSIF